MLLLADRNYAAADLITTLAATGAHLPIRCKNGRKLPTVRRHHDGSFSSIIGRLPIRVIEHRSASPPTTGIHTGGYRLLTTLLDPPTHPAAELVQPTLPGLMTRAAAPIGMTQRYGLGGPRPCGEAG